MLNKFRRDEKGVALISVIIVASILLALVVATTAFAINSLDLSRHDQDWNASLAAAESGIDDYLYRLNRNGFYWQYSSSNPPPDGNQAFSQWVDVPETNGRAQFQYRIDASMIDTQGAIEITSTGRVRDVTRTVQSLLRRRTFLDYLYFTEYETTDPVRYSTADGYPWDAPEAQTRCARHYYDTPPRDEDCSNISFFSRDTIRGPLHSNDALLIAGDPKFLGDTSSSWSNPPNANQRWWTEQGGNPQFARPGDPAFQEPLFMPSSNTSIKVETDPPNGQGCLYTGPTKIVLNAAGSMTVTSPLTRVTRSTCPTNGTGPLPPNGVIYVQGVPAASSDPNYTGTCTAVPPGRNHLGYPFANDVTAGYGCFDGDVFIEGQLQGQLTVAAADTIIITGNLTYVNGTTGNDILGLVADNSIEVYHPVSCTRARDQGCDLPVRGSFFFTDPVISAAMISLAHSFIVQNYRVGSPKGILTVNGAIAQQFRGPVGTFSGSSTSTGYEKNYTYDQRLTYLSPPHFLDPVASAWGAVTWNEINPQITVP